MTETFNFSDKAKKILLGLIAIGILGLILGFVLYSDNNRVWANLLLNGYYFLGITLAAIFFVSVHQVGYSGWHVLIKRIPEAMGAFIPFASAVILLIVIGTAAGFHTLYEWAVPGVTDPNSDNYDSIIAGKAPYLNIPFFTIRIVIYIILWIALITFIRKLSQKEDLVGVSIYGKSKLYATLFLVVFAITSSTMSWDLVMSIDSHWYSTLFGWLNFSSYLVASVAIMILILIYLKSRGYMSAVNENHLHDLGKYLFGFSIFYTYLWFSQYLLIWYGNIPEATYYYYYRFKTPFFQILFFASLIINFILPFFVLMTRKSKRRVNVLAFVSIMLLIGHWIGFYFMIMPGTVGPEASIGIVEIFMAIGFFAAFFFIALRALTTTSLLPVNNPYVKESLKHHT
ncbi:MAG: quinol:cytochrome C oxidoreductase [Chitinophagaceae bacterium]|nr:MAG: quinol:cytochrome C oxidoreductase [Chitinophagaceae bacterium]